MYFFEDKEKQEREAEVEKAVEENQQYVNEMLAQYTHHDGLDLVILPEVIILRF